MKACWNRNKCVQNMKVFLIFGLHNHTLFILHILTYYDFLRILLCSEICIDTEETDVGNVLFIYHMLLHFVQREKELGCLKKLHIMDLIKFLI